MFGHVCLPVKIQCNQRELFGRKLHCRVYSPKYDSSFVKHYILGQHVLADHGNAGGV